MRSYGEPCRINHNEIVVFVKKVAEAAGDRPEDKNTMANRSPSNAKSEFGIRAALDDFIHQAEIAALLGGHIGIAFQLRSIASIGWPV